MEFSMFSLAALRRYLPLFGLFLFVTCFIFSVLVPPFQSPDEFDHIKRAHLLTKGVITLDTPEGKSSGGNIDSGLLSYMHYYQVLVGKPERKLSIDEIEEASQIRWSGVGEYSSAPGTGYYLPLIYAPQAIGLIVGESLGMSVDNSYKLARISVLIFSSLILVFAFRIYPPPLFALSLLILPMSIFQMASASLDAVCTALAVLAISAFMRISQERANSRPWMLWLLTLCVILLASSRVHLLPLVFLIFAVYHYTKNVTSLFSGGAALVTVFAWIFIALKTTVDLRVITGAPTTSIISYYLFSPLSFFDVLQTTLSNPVNLTSYLESFFGILGWLDAPLPKNAYSYLYALTILILIASISIRNIYEEWFARALLCLCAALSILLIFFALLITWNAHPAMQIQGVQGRYFLTPVLLIAYCVGANCKNNPYLSLAGGLLLLALFLCSSFYTAKTLLVRYYVSNGQIEMPRTRMQPSLPLAAGSPIQLGMIQKQKDDLAPLKRIGVLVGTYARQNPGDAELRLTGRAGVTFSTTFSLSDLEDNQYRYFDINSERYDAGEVRSVTGGGISTWESHDASGRILTCIVYEYIDGRRRHTVGCPQ